MKYRWSIRNKFVLAVFIGCLLPYVGGGLILRDHLEEEFYRGSLETGWQSLGQAQEMVDASLTDAMEGKLSFLAQDPRLVAGARNLSSYLTYEAGAPYPTPGKEELALGELFQVLGKSDRKVDFVFFGTEEGGYLEEPAFRPFSAYDPRVRPWYQEAIASSEVVISEPYMTRFSGELVLSFSKRVVGEGKVLGVAGLAMRLDELAASLEKIRVGEAGRIWILSPESRFIISPGNDAWLLRTPEELGLSSLSFLSQARGGTYEAEVEGHTLVVSTRVSPASGLRFAVVQDKEEILARASGATLVLLGIYGSTFLLVFALIVWLSGGITGAILEFSSVIRGMKDFDTRFTPDQEIFRYAARKDEIGLVASSLVELHAHHGELMKQVRLLEEGVRTIDLEAGLPVALSVSKDNPFRRVVEAMNALFRRTVRYVEELHLQVARLDERNEYIRYLAYHDSLTRMPNRRAFLDTLTERLEAGESGGVVLLDLDDFKGINDTRGHLFGDRLLVAVAGRLASLEEEGAYVSRIGGDEFLLLLPLGEGQEDLSYWLSAIAGLFQEKVAAMGVSFPVRFSMGVALFPEHGTDVNELVMQADLAMYGAKKAGKNGYRVYESSMMAEERLRAEIQEALSKALEEDGLTLVYQAKVDLKSGRVAGYEALLRLADGSFSPGEFIPVAEANGSILELGRWVAREVISDLAAWSDSPEGALPVSFNCSVAQLQDREFPSYLQSLLREKGVSPSLLEVEITENLFLEDREGGLAFLDAFHGMGVRVSIDDFGTGFSSLNYLSFLPVDVIKLDGSLVVRFLEDGRHQSLSELVSFVRSLGLLVVAEGIERLDQVLHLRESGCDLIQGYYFSRPVPPEEVPSLNGRVFDMGDGDGSVQ